MYTIIIVRISIRIVFIYLYTRFPRVPIKQTPKIIIMQ